MEEDITIDMQSTDLQDLVVCYVWMCGVIYKIQIGVMHRIYIQNDEVLNSDIINPKTPSCDEKFQQRQNCIVLEEFTAEIFCL